MITNNIQYTSQAGACSAQFDRSDLEHNFAIACKNGDVGSVRSILRKGLNPNFQTTEGTTPLILASSEGHIDVIPWLFTHRADVDMRDKDRRTALMWAAGNGRMDVVDVLSANANGASIDMWDKNGWTALIWAARNGHTEIVKALLTNVARIDMRDKDGRTALILAAYSGHAGVVKALLTNVARIDMRDKDGRTALILAAYSGHTGVVKALLANGASIDMQDEEGWTALMWAAANGHMGVVKALLANGADADMQDKKGHTALIEAAVGGYIDILEELLKHGANICVVNGDGKNMLLALRETSPDRHKQIKARLASVEDSKEYNKFHRKVQNVCHLYGIGGTSEFQTARGNIVFKRLGVYDKYYSSMFAKNLETFSEKIADETVQEAMSNICSMLTKHAGSAHVSSDELAKQYVQGTPILVSGGFSGHQAVYCFWKTHCILVNRGGGSRQPIEIFPIEEETCRDHGFFVRLLSEIRQIQESGTKDDFENFLNDEFQQPQYLPRTALESFLESKLALPPQTVGNCGFAGVEGAVFALLALEALYREVPLDQGECDEICQKNIERIVQSQRKIFDEFSRFLKATYWEKYQNLTRMPRGRMDFDILRHVSTS